MAIAAPASAPDGTLTGFEAQQGLNTLESPSSGADGITGDICPAATVSPFINLQNRRDAIETGYFGPINPSLPNNEYWQEAAAEWNASIEFVKHARCGNCAAFNITTAMRECISAGSQSLDAWVLVEAGQLGYCEVFDFRCAAKRRCNMWVAGGPLTDDLAQQFTGYDYDLEEYKSDAALFKFNPNHDDDTGRFSTGGGGGSAGAEGGSATTSQIATVAMTRGVLTSAKVPVGSASSTGFTIRAGAQTIQKNGYVQVTHVPTAGTSREVRVAEVAQKLEAYNKLFKNAGFKTQLINRAMATEQGTIAQVRVYSKESVKFNPNHDASGRFSSGGGGGSSAAARAGKLAKELESKLGDKSGPPHGFAADGARREDDTDDEEESAHYDYILTLPRATQDAIDRYTQHSDDINGVLRERPGLFERARDLHNSGDYTVPEAVSTAMYKAGIRKGTPEFTETFSGLKDAVRVDKAIEGAPPMKERIVLRGLVGTNTTLEVIVARANSDGIVKLKGVVSASTDPSVARRFTVGEASADKPFVMEIKTKRGLLVEGISGQGEQEVLLRPNANYKILGTGTGKFGSVKEFPTLQLQLLGKLGE